MAKQNPPHLTKICSNCGEQKPLSAFLQMSGTSGTAYGNICASCRKILMEEQRNRRKKTEVEGGTSSETGHKIDSKSKLHADIEKEADFHKTEEEYHKERDIMEEESLELEEEKEEKKHKEREHREKYLKKDKKEKSPAEAKKEAQQEHAEEQAEIAHGVHETHKKTKHDFKHTFHGQQIGGQIRFQGEYFQRFKQWLGNSAPVVRNLNQTERAAKAKKAGAIAAEYGAVKETSKAAQNKEKPKAGGISQSGLMSHRNENKDQKKDAATQYVEKNWRPGSKR